MPTLPAGTPATPPANATTTTFQVGTYNALTDTFTSVYDLNDFTNTWLHNAATKFQPGKKVAVRSSNMRVNGERVVRWRRPNGHITVECYIRDTTPQAVMDRVHSLIAAVDSTPYVIRFAEPGATSYSYFDVVLCDHTEPYDPMTLNANSITHIQLDFEVRPEYRGDRRTLDNLVFNPGFEAPNGPGTPVFADTFANNDAYTLVSGTMPATSANTLVIPSGTTVSFGSPAWGAIQTWQVRWQFVTGLIAEFHLHRQDANNYLYAFAQSGSITLGEVVGGTFHQLAQTTYAGLTANNWYWVKITQYPAAPGTAPYLTATVYNDSAGTIGTQVGTASAATYDTTTALTGKMEFTATSAVLTVGGAYSNVNAVWLFGPGAWQFLNSGAGLCSGAWEQTTSNTYPNGPVTSFGAARIDIAPAGAVNAYWTTYNGATPAGSYALPVNAAGDVLKASAWVKSSGLSGTATLALQVYEYDATGASLRNTTLQTLTGNQAAWVELAGAVTTGVSTAYASVFVAVADATAGASANGTVWIDNVQCWDQTLTGMATMPYCELRFPQSPAQLVISGIEGDAPAQAMVATGMYVGAAWTNSSLSLWLARRAQASASAQLVGLPEGSIDATYVIPALDSSAYGGWAAGMAGGSGSQDFQLGGTPLQSDMLGVYHMFCRLYPTPASITLAAWEVQELAQATALYSKGYPLVGGNLSNLAPTTTQNAWNVLDAGQIPVPYAAQGALNDPTQLELAMGAEVNVASGNLNGTKMDWLALLPIDSELLILQFTVPSGATQQDWVYLYADGLGLHIGQRAAQSFSFEAVPLANPAQGAGIGGVANNGYNPSYYQLASTADPYPMLDPTQPMQLNGTAVNQFVCIATDNTGAVLPVATEIRYSPVYLFPR